MHSAETAFRKVFAGRHVILPVIHVANEAQAMRNVLLARDAGCDGVFLINHGMKADRLLLIQHAVRDEQPKLWMGVNCLSVPTAEVFALLDDTVDGVWVDDAGIDENNGPQPEADAIESARQASGWSGLYFGGVAFKYRREVGELEQAARISSRYMDIVTTSGPGTGEAAEPNKLGRMRQALGTFPLALASGVTPENVTDYLPFVDCFLAATGISKSFTELDPAKVAALVERVRGYVATS